VFLGAAWFYCVCLLCVLVVVVGVFLVFLLVYLFVFGRIEYRWSSMECVLADLVSKCVNLQEAVYTYFTASNC